MRLSYLPKLPGVDVGFIDITYKVAMTRRDYCVLLRQSGDKTILKEISGVFRSGELAAIMGPSECLWELCISDDCRISE